MHFLLFSALFVGQVGSDAKDRERHPLAPSLPLLTREEEKKIEAIIDRFVQYDIGKLKGAEGKKALEDFNTLGRESTFLLLEALNRTANYEASCPAVIIAKKLSSIFLTTTDIDLLNYARDIVGAGVTAKRHQNLLLDLKFQITLRRGALQRQGYAAKSLGSMTLSDLEKAAAKGEAGQLKKVLAEAEKRPGAKAVDILLVGIKSSDPEVVRLSQGYLAKNLQRQSGSVLKTMLQHERAEVRVAAAQAVGAKKLRYGTELISLLQDSDASARQAARRSLVQLSGGQDFGPDMDADATQREAAAERWRTWWSRQK